MANEPEEKPREDGTLRRAHYGSGKQPWDIIVELGWGPEFAAGNVLKYLRRMKDEGHSLDSARWYWARLHEMAERGTHNKAGAMNCLDDLSRILTDEEFSRLGVRGLAWNCSYDFD